MLLYALEVWLHIVQNQADRLPLDYEVHKQYLLLALLSVLILASCPMPFFVYLLLASISISQKQLADHNWLQAVSHKGVDCGHYKESAASSQLQRVSRKSQAVGHR